MWTEGRGGNLSTCGGLGWDLWDLWDLLVVAAGLLDWAAGFVLDGVVVEEDFADQPENAGGADGGHHARGSFGAHFCFNLWTHEVKTSAGVSRVMQRRSMGQVLRKQGLQDTL